MNQADVLEISRLTFIVILKAGGPIMAAGLVVGLIIAVFQTLTSIQEMTLTFVPKIIIIFAAVIVFMPFMMTSVIDFTNTLYDKIVGLG
ncbi:MAG TPA: flagellar biosynthesis protein FliQ [Rhodospirillales bacterium]|jgi:flagellar biosynthetic protein FliQ|nr:flagellar biosynthesis protein FliQ [Rhodospirillales bacterium]HHZ75721.1 flagellar biosynthesis protein FliQ [Rhodospirillales bacterium]HIA80750.1 flagellar biosynthesis protein FliQ [Rhodospirillales bacterium]HIB22327.1 flagellar biosynthesis protein FliQ [Rhodospirillales bacterium]HIC59874.1 flagellar biosynthesis protein FliQ [Rhodospirillales bacterium]|tara:strand:+ start:436 stop:702 length:267 start_codon:yes stop_codon:yes gene_type:complete